MERTLNVISEGKYCQGEHVALELATHSVTDAQQTADGWEETAPRYGCAKHPVTPCIIDLAGKVWTFAEWTAAHANA